MPLSDKVRDGMSVRNCPEEHEVKFIMLAALHLDSDKTLNSIYY